ncbi:MAG: AAA family ATPase [Thermoplasmata archaeon]
MLRVAAVAGWILDHWRGPKIDKDTVLLTPLLHDIGNIVKADIDKYPVLFSEDLQDLPYWRAVQATIRERYGKTDQDATMSMAREIGVSQEVLELLERKTFVRNEETARSDDWNVKIAAYADQRVAPLGVLPLRERLMEAKRRYEGVTNASVNNPRWPRLLECAIEIEKQLQGKLDASVDHINDDSTEGHVQQLRNYLLPELRVTNHQQQPVKPMLSLPSSVGGDADSQVKAFLSERTEIRLSRYCIVGGYTRFDELSRNHLKDTRQRMVQSLDAGSSESSNFLLWGPPGSGKTFFVREVSQSLAPRVRYVEVNLTEIDEAAFRNAIAEVAKSPDPTLCLVDEIDSRPTEPWPYEALLVSADRSGTSANPKAFVFAGSSSGGVEEMKRAISGRPKGADLLSRIPMENVCELPVMTPEDRILVGLSNLRRAGEARGHAIVEVEKLALYYMAIKPELANARQLREFARRCVDRVPAAEERVKYDNLFMAGDPENKEFWSSVTSETHLLAGRFLRIDD